MAWSSFLFLIHLFCGMFMLRSPLMEAQSNHNVSLGSTLSPLGPQKSWRSPSGDFAFGFLRVRDDKRFLLAIWFDKTEPKTVVWSATNRSTTREMALKVTADAQLVLTHAQLVLTDAQNRVLWNTIGVSDDVSHAAMLDDGNFVLAGPDGSPRWQSFQHPTDTLLPGQSLLPGYKLRSMDTGKSDKRFELLLDINGSNLSLYAITLQSDTSYGFYWSLNTSNSTQLCFQQSRLVLVLMNESVINITSPSPETETDKVYQKATLDADGVFRQYVHPKSNATMAWKTVAFVPEGICKMEFTYGSGICGFNSYCIMDEDKVDCMCPPQYSYFDPNRKFRGCKQDFSSQSCEVDQSSMFELKAMVNVDWPLSAYDHFQPMQEEECKEVCLTDCLCAAVIFWNSTGDCWKKRHPMSNGRSGDFVNRTAYIKIPKGEGEGEGGGGSSLAVVATSWGYVMPQIVVPNAKK